MSDVRDLEEPKQQQAKISSLFVSVCLLKRQSEELYN